jgi:hypothetical protein
MRNRLVLCLLISAVLMYYAIPRLTIHFSGLDGFFALSWFILAFFVIGGNLASILYMKKKSSNLKNKRRYRSKKSRRYVSEH